MQKGKSRSIKWKTAKEFMKKNVLKRDYCRGKRVLPFKVAKTCVMGVKPTVSWICSTYRPIACAKMLVWGLFLLRLEEGS